MRSRQSGREYRILIARPEQPAPPGGFPVVYLLDGNAVFATMVEAVRLQSRRPERTGVVPAIIVGIGYPTEQPFSAERYYDFTLPVPPEALPAKPGGGAWPAHGGAQAFLAFIEEELKPQLERELPIDCGRQTIFGHSLGGLFVLHTLLSKPQAFSTYIAGSPSIHWNPAGIAEQERGFAQLVKGQAVRLNALITVGEQDRKSVV